MTSAKSRKALLESFEPAVARWFEDSFPEATRAQLLGWPPISRGESTLIFAPTGSGKTLTAFLWCINRLMFSPLPETKRRCRALYVSPLKALAVDVERNLRSPIVGIGHVATTLGVPFVYPEIAIRTGDTPQRDRVKFLREPADILITTPESLYLMLTSSAREVLRSVETVIIDEIHSLVPTKRGVHLALSLERLGRLVDGPLQRIGLSATQRPLDEVARFLGGVELRKGKKRTRKQSSIDSLTHEFADDEAAQYRPVTIVDTGERKKLEITVEVPVEDMAKLGEIVSIPSGPASQPSSRASIWPAIHPNLLALIKEHRSTLIFVNSRRLAERLASSLNELAGEDLVKAHHGSLAREQRVEIEDNLKLGRIRALVATSSLELGIDMGAIDLVIQVEAPPSIASGMQRIGRASHQVGTVSEGVIYPKYRGDLVACAAITRAMHEGRIEPTRYPRNPLDVLAQQIVAMTSVEAWQTDELFRAIRCAAPYAALARPSFDGVLDMLSGLYPSDEFAELRPRINWDRVANRIVAREGAKRVAIINGGTIPDRGLYGVFLEGAEKGQGRVGELDEEMVFESRVGETFLLGASTWKIQDIRHDRVIVSPAPGQPGKMPFWHGDSAERTIDFGREIGALVREVRELPPGVAVQRLEAKHDLGTLAAENLIQYLRDQQLATTAVPDDETIVIERCLDELGDWLLCLLSPYGGRVLAPWAMAVLAKVRAEKGIDVEAMWTDDGFIIRFPETDAPPDASLLIPTADEVEELVVHQLASSSLFAAKFRENAARALLLPRRAGATRTPLWQQRKRAYDLLQVASRFGSFPILLESYRECLRDVFDVPALVDTLRRIEQRRLRVVIADTERPSPFTGSLLFRYVANYIYDGDAPLAERRAQALAIDQSQLRELLGEAELRELLDPDALDSLERELQRLDPERRVKNADALHDLVLRLGDLSPDEIAARSGTPAVASLAEDLSRMIRLLRVRIAGELRFIAVEDASRYRDAVGVALPPGIPDAYLRSVRDPLRDLLLRYARTHGPFTTKEPAARLGLPVAPIESALNDLTAEGKLVEGEFRPGGTQREWCHADVLRTLRRRSLAKLRKEVEPVSPAAYARLLSSWHGVAKKRSGLNALLEAIDILQGAPIPASILDTEILPARVEGYRSTDLDTLAAAGEIVWVGVEPVGDHDGRIALFLTDHLSRLRRDPVETELGERESVIAELLAKRGALFFDVVHDESGGGFPNDTLQSLWNLVWKGIVTNDGFHALRRFVRGSSHERRPAFRSRRLSPPGSEGRWSLVTDHVRSVSATESRVALAQQLLTRYGVAGRETVQAEDIAGGFSRVYEILKGLEESGKIRRGYFVAEMAATQFAQPGVVDLLRNYRDTPDKPEVVMLAATDPANPYGSIFRWPAVEEGRSLLRTVGASVILVNGALAAYLFRGEKQLYISLPDDRIVADETGRAVAHALSRLVDEGERRAMLITDINGEAAHISPFAHYFSAAGFATTSQGLQKRAVLRDSSREHERERDA